MGKRGPQKGVKYAKTLQKEELKAILRARVAERWHPLIDAQIANATGIHYLVVRDKATGKFLRVGKGAAERLKPTEETIEIWEKDPSAQAFSYLTDQAIDKAVQPQKVTGEDGGPVAHVFTWQK